MSTRVSVSVGFYFQQQHYAQLVAYLPRTQAQKITNLRFNQALPSVVAPPKIQQKKQSEDEMSEEEKNDGEMEQQLQGIQNPAEDQMQVDQDNQVQIALKQLEQDNQHYDSQDQDDDQDDEEDIDLDSLSSQMKGFGATKTKRQKGDSRDLVQLPDRRPRKDKKNDEAGELIRRQQKERKRKQYLKKQIQAQEKATLQKILNETGRKLRLREQKETKQTIQRQQKHFKTLGDVPKIITIDSAAGKTVMLHNTSLFSQQMTRNVQQKMRECCSICGKVAKYRIKGSQKWVCSLPCYKNIVA